MSSPHVASERPEGEEDSATVLEKKTSSEVVEDEGKHDRLVRRATTDDRMPLACPTCANCGPRDASANRFRSNVEIIEKPRQMIVLFATIGVAIYLGFAQDKADREDSTRAATAGASFLFVVHCFLQCRDSLFVRPHPGAWRVVHAIGMLYLLAIAVLFYHTKDEGRRLLAIFVPDVKGQVVSNFESAGPLDCELTFSAVLSQLREVWFLAHLLGWWCKMCLFRDWGVCWVLSISFELLELSMGWLVPQFHECWWDSLIIDLLGANLLGMVLGLYTLRFLETRTFDWSQEDGSGRLASSLRVLSKFSPFRWSKWRWQAFSSFKRTAQVLVMMAVTMLLELNAFMLMNALEIPKNSNFNVIRITVLFFLGLLASNEFYEYCSNPHYDRLGQNAWLVLAIMQMEILLWVKFFPQPLMNASSPPEVKLPWLATLSLFSLWGMLFFAVSEDRMAALRGGESMSASHDSSSSLLDADGSAKHVDVGGVGDGNGRVTNSVTSGRGNAATDSVRPANTKQKTALLVAKWGLVDAGFVLSFLPLLYLVKQWSY